MVCNRLQNDVHMIIHHNVSKQFVTYIFKVTQCFNNCAPFLRLQHRAIWIQAPRDEINRAFQTPVRQITAIYLQITNSSAGLRACMPLMSLAYKYHTPGPSCLRHDAGTEAYTTYSARPISIFWLSLVPS